MADLEIITSALGGQEQLERFIEVVDERYWIRGKLMIVPKSACHLVLV